MKNIHNLDDDQTILNLGRAFVILLGVLIVLNIVQIALLINVKVNVNKLSESYSNIKVEETTPETEEVNETTECTTAPVETSIPETEETIPDTDDLEPIENVSSEAPSEAMSGEYYIGTPTTDLEMLACVIYQEVGGDAHCDQCRYRVADVVLNRVASDDFPNTIYGVLTEEGQYGEYYWTGLKWKDRAKYDSEKHAVERAYRIAADVLAGNHSELYGNGYVWQAGHVQGTDGFRCCGHWFGR
jgi:hypothetical protein